MRAILGIPIFKLFEPAHYYENMPIQIYRKFHLQKLKKIQIKNSDIVHISAQNIVCGYLLEPPWLSDSNEYPQSMVLSKIRKNNNVYHRKPKFYYKKGGFRGSKLYRHVFVMTTKPTLNLCDRSVFAGRMCLLQLPSYPKKTIWEPLPYWVDAQTDLSNSWSHRD